MNLPCLIKCNLTIVDLHEYLGGPNICPTTPHPITGTNVPLTFGHEFSGIVEEVGEGVKRFKEGDRVCVEPIIWDGSCTACKDGFHNCCDKGGFVGLSGAHILNIRLCRFANVRRLGRWSFGALRCARNKLIPITGQCFHADRW